MNGDFFQGQLIENRRLAYADLIEPTSADLAESIPQILDRKPAIVILADVETIPDEARTALSTWVEDGGTLIRFAGPRLASADNEEDDDLLPVRLRRGERALGGTLSWTEPQPVADFPPTGPFAGLSPPREVTVQRQVLAEPTPDIVERTWANLADGTPLVTGAPKGDGTVVPRGMTGSVAARRTHSRSVSSHGRRPIRPSPRGGSG